MPRGGARHNLKGRAGRKKGSTNLITKKKYERLERLEKSGQVIMPLDYMLAVLADPTADVDRRDKMAANAAPYCHNRLSSVTMRTDPNAPVTVVTATMTQKEAAAAYAAMLREEEKSK